MNVNLISFYNRLDEYASKYSLGTLRLASYIGQNTDITVKIIPMNSEEEITEEDITKILKNSPEVVGIPNYMWTEKKAQKLSEGIKKRDQNILRVIGGPSTADIDFKDWQSDEIFILGEGEEALLEVCEEKLKNPDFNAGEIDLLNANNVFSQSVDMPDKHVIYTDTNIPRGIPLFSERIEEMKDDKQKEDFAWYETVRGCAYNCGYCGHKTRNNLGYIDPENVKEEIKNIKKQGIKRLFIVDPIIGGTKQKGKNILRMCNEEIPDTKLIVYLRPEMLDDEFVEILSECNLEEMRFGIQTLNPNVPGWVRSNSIPKIQEELSKLHGKNINWRAELIVGLPGDDMQGLKQSVKTVINDFQPMVLAGYHLTAIKGTRLYQLVEGTEDGKWIKIDENSEVTESYSYTREEFEDMAKYSVIVTSLYNVVKQSYPTRSVNYDKLMQFIRKHIDGNIDMDRIVQFDTQYAEDYWNRRLKEIENEKASHGTPWRITRKPEEDYSR